MQIIKLSNANILSGDPLEDSLYDSKEDSCSLLTTFSSTLSELSDEQALKNKNNMIKKVLWRTM